MTQIIGTKGNDSLNGANGSGSNIIIGGTGDDTLVAGVSGDILIGNSATAGAVDLSKMKIAQDVTAQVTFDGSGAGYHNAVGVYTYDSHGAVTGVQVIYGDVSGAGVGAGLQNTSISLRAGDHVGFFVASNANSQGDAGAVFGANGGAFKLVDATTGGAANVNSGDQMNLVYVDAKGNQTTVQTEYGNSIFTSNTADNVDKFAHAQVKVDPLSGKMSVAFEDLLNGGDQNFYDANFSLNIGVTNATQLAHAKAVAVNNDALVGLPSDADAVAVSASKLRIDQDTTATVSFDRSGAGYHNAVGMFTYDGAGNIDGVQVVYSNVSGAGVGAGLQNTSMALKAGQHLGFFEASNAGGQGDASTVFAAGGTYKIIDATTNAAGNVNSGHPLELVYVAPDGTQTVVQTQFNNQLFTSSTANNSDNFQHAHLSLDAATGKVSVAFEDLLGGGDKNWGDANFSVNIGTADATAIANSLASSQHPNNNDSLLGGVGADTLMGLSGNDTLNGGLGNNALFGGSGNDSFIAGGGNDTIDGGSGSDVVDFSAAAQAVTVNLSKHTETGFGADTLKSIEGVIGSSYNDLLQGSKNAELLVGGAGNDTLRGVGGADTLAGGSGNDTFLWLKNDVVDASGHSLGTDEVTDFGNGKDVLDLHNLFNGIKGGHAGLVSFVDGSAGTALFATVGGHSIEVAVLDGAHNLSVASLIANGQLIL